MTNAAMAPRRAAYRPALLSNRPPAVRGPQLGVAPFILAAGRLLLPLALGAGAVLVGGNILKEQLGIDTSRIPLSAVLAGAGAAAYVAADLVPDSAKPVAYLVAIGGTVGSIAYLFGGPRASGGQEPFPPASPEAVRDIQVAVTFPSDNQVVRRNILGTMPWAAGGMPLIVALHNPTPRAATFNLDVEWDESPTFLGYTRDPNRGNATYQVTVEAGQNVNHPIRLPIVTSGLWNWLDVLVTLGKRATATSTPVRGAQRAFRFEQTMV